MVLISAGEDPLLPEIPRRAWAANTPTRSCNSNRPTIATIHVSEHTFSSIHVYLLRPAEPLTYDARLSAYCSHVSVYCGFIRAATSTSHVDLRTRPGCRAAWPLNLQSGPVMTPASCTRACTTSPLSSANATLGLTHSWHGGQLAQRSCSVWLSNANATLRRDAHQ